MWKFTPVLHRTLALWDRADARQQSRATGTADQLRSLDGLLFCSCPCLYSVLQPHAPITSHQSNVLIASRLIFSAEFIGRLSLVTWVMRVFVNTWEARHPSVWRKRTQNVKTFGTRRPEFEMRHLEGAMPFLARKRRHRDAMRRSAVATQPIPYQSMIVGRSELAGYPH